MLEALFAAAAEAVFSYILDTLEPAERLRDWLKRNPAKLAYQHALARTYAAFARQYPELTASLFNESFLRIEAAPELARFLARDQHPDHTQLVRLWAKSIAPQTDAGQRSIEAMSKREDLNAASAYFVELLTSELKHESALQPLFDSRALESLPDIEAKLDALAATLKDNLKQALAIANNYQQTVVNYYQQTISNRSGGVDFQAQEVTIGGDVVGRDKIVDNSIRVGDIIDVQAVAIGPGAHASVTNNYFTGDFVTLDDLYIRPDAVFQRVHVEDFVGREWLTAKVDHFLNDEKRKSGVFLLVGEAGVGKTSFMAHLVTERRYLHLFAEQVPGDAYVSRALQSLGAQLVARYQIDPYKEKGTLPAIATFPDFLDKLLRLAADKLSAGEKIVVVCDALDEAGTAQNGNVFGLPSVLPDGVYFILSQRPIATVKLSVKADLVKETIAAAGTDNLHDVEHYLTAVSRRPEVSNQLRAHNYTEIDFVRILRERSGGVWMYLFYVVSEIAAGSRASLDLATLPSGLAGYYTDYWGDWCEGRKGRGDDPAKWDAVYAPLLATLAAAQLPINLKLLLAWSKAPATEYEVERLLRRNWRAFIAEREIAHIPHFALYHASLRDFLTGQVDRQDLTLEAEQLIDELTRRTRDAHSRIVEYYRQQCNGEWVKLVDDDYARIHFCLHLSASGDDETMYQLVAMSNAWVEAKYAKEGSYAGYLVDLNRAWQYTETEAHWDVGRQIRCALIKSNIHSLAENVSDDLLRLLVQTGIWNAARALAHIPRIPNQYSRAYSLNQLAPLLSDDLKPDALSAACTITDEGTRTYALIGLAPHLPESLMADALNATRAVTDESIHARVLTDLAPHLPESLMADALSVAYAITDEYARASALTGLAPHLPEPLMFQAIQGALSAARAISNEFVRALHLHEELIANVLSIAGVTLCLPAPLIADALNATSTIADERIRARALIGLIPHLPEPLIGRAVQDALSGACAIVEEDNRAFALTRLAPHLPEPLMADALNATRAIADERIRVHALTSLIPHLSKPLKGEAVQDALSATSTIADECIRAHALISLAPHLPEPLMADVLSMARAITNEYARADALIGLALYLPEPLKIQALQEALSTTQTFTNEYARADALIGLAPHLPEPLKVQALQEAMSTTRAITDEYARARALMGLAPHLPGLLIGHALSMARAIVNEDYRADALIGLAPHLTKSLMADALNATRAIKLDRIRARVLISLAPHLPEPLMAQAVQEVLSAARSTSNESVRALHGDVSANVLNTTRALTILAPHLPEPLKIQAVQEALSSARSIGDEVARTRSLSAIAPYLTEPLRGQALQHSLNTARAISEEDYRADALTDLTPHLPETLMAEALNATCVIADEHSRARALTGLAPHLPEPLMAVALNATRAIVDEHSRARALTGLASHLPESLMADAMSTIYAITDEYARAYALAGLVPHLPESLKEVVQVTLSATRVLSVLPPSEPLKDQAAQDALSAACAITREEIRASALTRLAPDLPDPLKADVLSAARAITRVDIRAYALIGLAPHLSEPLKVQAVQDALSAVRAIPDEDVRAYDLIDLAPHLPELLKAEALNMVRAITNDSAYARALISLAPHSVNQLQIEDLHRSFLAVHSTEIGRIILIWSEKKFAGFQVRLWTEKLETLAQFGRSELMEGLTALLPLIQHLGGQVAIEDFYYALRDVTTWWP